MISKPKINPWESSFENLTTRPVKQIKKTVGDVVKTVAEDVKKQVVGEVKKPDRAEEMGVKEVPHDEKVKILAEQRRKMRELDEAIKKARMERIQKHQQAAQVVKQEEQKKKVEELKKKEEPVWKKMMNMGSQAERKVNAGG